VSAHCAVLSRGDIWKIGVVKTKMGSAVATAAKNTKFTSAHETS
jgi:hypothetical protein